jgi:hypothetical protein
LVAWQWTSPPNRPGGGGPELCLHDRGTGQEATPHTGR